MSKAVFRCQGEMPVCPSCPYPLRLLAGESGARDALKDVAKISFFPISVSRFVRVSETVPMRAGIPVNAHLSALAFPAPHTAGKSGPGDEVKGVSFTVNVFRFV